MSRDSSSERTLARPNRLRRHVDLFQNRKIVLRADAPFLEDFMVEFRNSPMAKVMIEQFGHAILQWIRSE